MLAWKKKKKNNSSPHFWTCWIFHSTFSFQKCSFSNGFLLQNMFTTWWDSYPVWVSNLYKWKQFVSASSAKLFYQHYFLWLFSCPVCMSSFSSGTSGSRFHVCWLCHEDLACARLCFPLPAGFLRKQPCFDPLSSKSSQNFRMKTERPTQV